MYRMKMKNAIALLITVFFIMAITLSVGVGLSYLKKAQETLGDENFLLQSSVIIDDVLTLLRDSKELQLIVKDTSGEALRAFLAQSSFIPFESSGLRVALQIKSARSKFNPNTLKDFNTTTLHLGRVNALRTYMTNKMINQSYVDILLDGMSGMKNNSYNSNIFYDNPHLYRDRILSFNHLKEFNEFYKNTFYDNSLQNIEFENLFYFSKNPEKTYEIDLNYATAQTWELLLGVDKNKAEELAFNTGFYTDDDCPDVPNFDVTCTPQFYLDVQVEIIQGKSSAKIAFEYDIKTKQGYNFYYEI